MVWQIKPSTLQGSLSLPSSKSHTLRAILFALMAEGTSTIHRYLPSPDTDAMIEAAILLGASIKIEQDTLLITGTAGNLKAPKQIFCGNSGLVLRLIGALSALIPDTTIFAGDASIAHNRPVQPLIDGLNQLGAKAHSLNPLVVTGPLTKSSAIIDGADSQPVSGLLIAAAFASHPIEISVVNPGEKPWIDLTLYWLEKFSIPYQRQGYTRYRLEGSAKIHAFSYTVPGDFSSAAFPIAAALLTQSALTIHNVDMNDVQGDKAIVPLLEQMGARLSFQDQTLIVHEGTPLQGCTIDINHMIDALPILAVISCFAKTPTTITGAAIARKKECDRIACIAKELKKMGAILEEKEDGLIIHPSSLQGASLHSHHDHRLAMSLCIASLAAKTPSSLYDTDCIAKTYPNFRSTFQTLGAQID